MESHWLKIALYHNSQKVGSGSKKMGPVFHRLHITENFVGVPKMFYLKTNVWKICLKAVVPSLFLTADRSMHDNFTAALEYSMMVALFQQPKWSYQDMNHQIRLLRCSLQLCSMSNTLTLCSNALTLCTQQCFHGKNWQITCANTWPLEREAMGRMCLFIIIS